MESNLSAIFQIIVKSGQMFYKNKLISFSKGDFEVFSATLPEMWWNPKDTIEYFTYYSDGSYFCEREKTFYNYSLKSESKRVYEFNSLSDESAKEVFKKFTEFFEEARIKELRLQKEVVRNTIQENFDFITIQYRNLRDLLLKESDWVVLSDVLSKKSEEEILMWQTYRQFLRDMPQSDAWINKDYLNIVFPLNPSDFNQNFPGEEYMSSPSHFENVATLSIKDSVNKILKTLVLPSVEQGVSENPPENQEAISLLIDTVNEKLRQIDETLRIEIKVTADF